MTHVIIAIGDNIADDIDNFAIEAILGAPNNTGHYLCEVDSMREELASAGVLDALFDDEIPSPGLYLIPCHIWAEQDRDGDWDGGIEVDDPVVRYEDGAASVAIFEAVIDAAERTVCAILTGPIGSLRDAPSGCHKLELIADWVAATQAVIDADERVKRAASEKAHVCQTEAAHA